jgi:hypothetical protein
VFDALVSHDTEPIIKAQSTIKKNATLFMTISCLRQFVKPEPPTFKCHAHLLNETCLKEQDANFWYDFRNDCASQRASNLLEFLSALRAFALRLVNFHQLSTSEHLFPGGFGKQRTACTLR